MKILDSFIERKIEEWINDKFTICNKCGCLIPRRSSWKVAIQDQRRHLFWSESCTKYYCKLHAPEYDKVVIYSSTDGARYEYYRHIDSVDKLIERSDKCEF